jgi:hypothetical protein
MKRNFTLFLFLLNLAICSCSGGVRTPNGAKIIIDYEKLQSNITLFLDSTRGYAMRLDSIGIVAERNDLEFHFKHSAKDSMKFDDYETHRFISEFLFYEFVRDVYASPLQRVSFVYHSDSEYRTVTFFDSQCSNINEQYSSCPGYYNTVRYILMNVSPMDLYRYQGELRKIDLGYKIPPDDNDFYKSLLDMCEYKAQFPGDTAFKNLSMLRLMGVQISLAYRGHPQPSTWLTDIFKLNTFEVRPELNEKYGYQLYVYIDSLDLEERFMKKQSWVDERIELYGKE